MKSLSIIAPCYNEESVINEAYKRIKAVFESLNGFQSQIIFVNDGSWDNTAQRLSAIAQADSQVKVLHFSRNFGHQVAVATRVHHCTSDLAYGRRPARPAGANPANAQNTGM